MDDQTNNQPEVLLEQSKPGNHPGIFIILTILFAVLSVGVYIWQHNKVTASSKQISNYEKLVSLPNQACIGLSTASDNDVVFSSIKLSATTQLYHSDPDNRTVTYTCKTGQNTKDMTKGLDVAKIDSSGYEFGAEVTYFDSATAAKKYAEKKVNPLRYWSLDQEGQRQGIPQSSKFTSIINGTTPYFDSYTVSGNALVRVSLPCEFSAKFSKDPWKCSGQAADTSVAYYTIKSFSESIQPLTF